MIYIVASQFSVCGFHPSAPRRIEEQGEFIEAVLLKLLPELTVKKIKTSETCLLIKRLEVKS